jgi:hypothetical protein
LLCLSRFAEHPSFIELCLSIGLVTISIFHSTSIRLYTFDRIAFRQSLS